jgi:hypothetical protein
MDILSLFDQFYSKFSESRYPLSGTRKQPCLALSLDPAWRGSGREPTGPRSTREGRRSCRRHS